jgi:integrase
MTVSGLQDVVEKYARLASLEGVTAHTLRHTFGKTLLDSGTDLDSIRESRLGRHLPKDECGRELNERQPVIGVLGPARA